MPTNTPTTGPLRVELKLLGFLLLISAIVCSHERYGYQEGLSQRILAPIDVDIHQKLPAPTKMAEDTSGGSQARLGQPNTADDADKKDAKLPTPAQWSGGNL